MNQTNDILSQWLFTHYKVVANGPAMTFNGELPVSISRLKELYELGQQSRVKEIIDLKHDILRLEALLAVKQTITINISPRKWWWQK